ncbi:homeobox protein dve-1-like isoform X2 [Lineus longissimus]|uniref:homeobox protein dve-1-like isoform X2 n=1 Tax=Lineus longissimus TaxID=88925 RepID=UPI00315D4921
MWELWDSLVNEPLDVWRGSGKSMPVHCLIETTASPQGFESGGGSVELDSYAIIPNTTLFSEIVRTALIKLGYSPSEAMGAKGAVQLKNWKPLTFDMITDNPEVTVEDILGDITPVATIRIKLCSQRKTSTTNDLKDKLLQVLLAQSRGMLLGSGCPIEKEVMTLIAKGETDNIDTDKRKAFDRWHQEQLEKVKATIKTEHTTTEPEEKTHSVPRSPSPAKETETPRVPPLPNAPTHKTRFRTSFDPDLEIPRLHQWFHENKHPTREKMIHFLSELNSLESRKGRKPLDLTNIIYWFKNARAAQRRASRSMEMSVDESHLMDNDDNSSDHHSTSDEHIPVLPNKNAVYVVNPLHNHNESQEGFRNKNGMFESSALDMTSQGQGQRYSPPAERNHEEAIDMSTSSRTDREIASSSVSGQSDNSDQRKSSSDEEMSDYEDDPDSVQIKQDPDAYLDHPIRSLPNSLPSNHMALHNSLTSPHSPAHAHMMSAAMNYRLGSLGHLGRNHSALGQHPFYSVMSPSMLEERRKRTRVFIDPLSEIPKLEKWFIEDTHPTAYMIEKYCDELNRSEYRQRFPKLEPKNVQLWFKNHRAKVKRSRLEIEGKTVIKSESCDGEMAGNIAMYRNSLSASSSGSQEMLGASYSS